MITIRVDTRGLRKAQETLVQNVNRKFRAHIYRMFEDALKVSAQFSGDYVSNFKIAVNSKESAYQMWPGKTGHGLTGKPTAQSEVHHAGDLEAIAYARQLAERLPFTYKDKVYFVNATPLEFTGKTVIGTDGARPLRPENLIGSGILLSSYLRAKYGKQ